MCLENCVGATIFSGNIPKSFDYMPKMPNKIVSVDPEAYLAPRLVVIPTIKATQPHNHAKITEKSVFYFGFLIWLYDVNII